MVKEIFFFGCFFHSRVAIWTWVSAFFIKLLYCYVLDKHCLMLALPAFHLWLFPEVAVIYPLIFAQLWMDLSSEDVYTEILPLQHHLGRCSAGLQSPG